MGPPRDAYVYHYSFNHSRLVDVVHVLFTTQQRLQLLNTSYQKSRLDETFPALAAEYIHNLDGRVSSFLMSTRNATQNIEKKSLYEENSTLLEV